MSQAPDHTGPRLTVVREPDPRWDLIARVRAEIENGTYITPEKLESAISRMAPAAPERG